MWAPARGGRLMAARVRLVGGEGLGAGRVASRGLCSQGAQEAGGGGREHGAALGAGALLELVQLRCALSSNLLSTLLRHNPWPVHQLTCTLLNRAVH